MNKNDQASQGEALTITSIGGVITPDRTLNPVIGVFTKGELAWSRLPNDSERVKRWRPALITCKSLRSAAWGCS